MDSGIAFSNLLVFSAVHDGVELADPSSVSKPEILSVHTSGMKKMSHLKFLSW